MVVPADWKTAVSSLAAIRGTHVSRSTTAGQHVVIGFNDFRGFVDASDTLSISGFMWSDDGGKTFVDGGRLPITTGTVDLGGTLLPQVFGDPDVKYLGGCNFIYTSIVIAPFGTASAVQTMGFHRSTDCGHTWKGPFVIDPASNPNGFVDDFGNPFDAADKEQIDVDRATGRVIVSWTNFSLEVEISTSYSDNVLAPVPTWSPRVIVGARPDIDGQAATPRFGPLGSNWCTPCGRRRRRSDWPVLSLRALTDNGASFAPPIDLDPGFFFPDQVLGNDRIHWFPTLAVDRSHGRNREPWTSCTGQNNSHDGGDVVVKRARTTARRSVSRCS